MLCRHYSGTYYAIISYSHFLEGETCVSLKKLNNLFGDPDEILDIVVPQSAFEDILYEDLRENRNLNPFGQKTAFAIVDNDVFNSSISAYSTDALSQELDSRPDFILSGTIIPESDRLYESLYEIGYFLEDSLAKDGKRFVSIDYATSKETMLVKYRSASLRRSDLVVLKTVRTLWSFDEISKL